MCPESGSLLHIRARLRCVRTFDSPHVLVLDFHLDVFLGAWSSVKVMARVPGMMRNTQVTRCFRESEPRSGSVGLRHATINQLPTDGPVGIDSTPCFPPLLLSPIVFSLLTRHPYDTLVKSCRYEGITTTTTHNLKYDSSRRKPTLPRPAPAPLTPESIPPSKFISLEVPDSEA